MASIQVSSISTTSFRARLTGLDSTYPRTDRTAWWELYRGSTRVANPSQSLGAKISSSSYQSFTGLTPNTSYTLSCYIDYTDAEGNWHQASVSYSGTITTDSLPTPSVTLTTTVLSHNAIRARFTYDSNYPYYRLRWKKSSSSTWTYSGSSYTSYGSTTNYSIGSLSTNTTYDIEVLVATSSSGANSSSGDTDSAKTLPALSASIEITSVGKNSVSGKVTVDSNYRYIQAIYRKASTNTPSYSPSSISNGYQSGSTWTFTISNLDEDTDYVLNGRCSATGEESYAYNIRSDGLTFHTLSSVSVTPWSWTSANSTVDPAHTAEATASQTTAARNACQNKTAVSNFKYQVWNDLVYKVYEYRKAKGKTTWNEHYANLSSTLMTSSSKTLTATRYNSMKYNLGEVYSTGISDVVSGVTEVSGTTHFLNFVTKLNQAINAL